MPNVVILAGPNGAGKTSAAPTLLRDELRVAEFVNADVIARGLSGFSADTIAVEAGRIMLRRLEELAGSGQDFAFETTLSGNTLLSAIDRWRSVGYAIRIVYLCLNSPETAIDRVHARATQGGHTVPDEVIRRRYERGLLNFAHRYRNAADQWHLYDNTDPPVADDHIERWFADPENLERAMRIVHARVIRRHRLLNQPLITSRDGKVVELDPHTVPMPEGVTEEEMGPVFDYL